MAKVNWSAGIDSVSGALAKPGKGSQHTCEHMLLLVGYFFSSIPTIRNSG